MHACNGVAKVNMMCCWANMFVISGKRHNGFVYIMFIFEFYNY